MKLSSLFLMAIIMVNQPSFGMLQLQKLRQQKKELQINQKCIDIWGDISLLPTQCPPVICNLHYRFKNHKINFENLSVFKWDVLQSKMIKNSNAIIKTRELLIDDQEIPFFFSLAKAPLETRVYFKPNHTVASRLILIKRRNKHENKSKDDMNRLDKRKSKDPNHLLPALLRTSNNGITLQTNA